MAVWLVFVHYYFTFAQDQKHHLFDSVTWRFYSTTTNTLNLVLLRIIHTHTQAAAKKEGYIRGKQGTTTQGDNSIYVQNPA